MRLKIGKLLIIFYISDQETENFPTAVLGLGYFCSWYYSTLLSTLMKRLYWGPRFDLYIFIGPKIVNLCFEWIINVKPTKYLNKAEMLKSRKLIT